MNVQIPTTSGNPIEFCVAPGSVTVVIGANGSGKSALGWYLGQNVTHHPVNRITGHRRLWLNSSGPDITTTSRREYDGYFQNWDTQPSARYKDQGETQRISAIIHDLVSQESYYNRCLRERVRAQQYDPADTSLSPIETVNAILSESGLDFQIEVDSRNEFSCRRRGAAEAYPIERMSDGEKNSFLLVGDAITAGEGSLHLIDEPERHLHRSISSPLLRALISARPQDSFAFFTHDIETASDLSQLGDLLVTSGVQWQDERPLAWELARVDSISSLDQDVRAAILGAKRAVLFHEGTADSLDATIYRTIFPEYNCIPVESCSRVIRAVAGIHGTAELHWLDAGGVIDRDFRSDIPPAGIYTLTVHEIENALFLTPILDRVCQDFESLRGEPTGSLFEAAKEEFFKLAERPATRDSILKKLAVSSLRSGIISYAESIISATAETEITIKNPHDDAAARAEYDQFIQNRDLDGYISRYPIRESPIPDALSRKITGFNKTTLRQASLALLRSDAAVRDTLRNAIAPEMVQAGR